MHCTLISSKFFPYHSPGVIAFIYLYFITIICILFYSILFIYFFIHLFIFIYLFIYFTQRFLVYFFHQFSTFLRAVYEVLMSGFVRAAWLCSLLIFSVAEECNFAWQPCGVPRAGESLPCTVERGRGGWRATYWRQQVEVEVELGCWLTHAPKLTHTLNIHLVYWQM